MATAQPLSCWSDLPPELLGLVLKRLPSLADRVRLRTVCQLWRSNARLQPLPPPLPWLALLDGSFLSIPDGKIIQMPVPDDAYWYCSIDNSRLLVHEDGKCSLMNPFSKDTLELPNLSTGWYYGLDPCSEFNPAFWKLVLPAPLDSSLVSLVAIMIDRYSICICQPPVVTDTMEGREPLDPLLEVSFFGGKLYAVDCSGKLLNFEVVEDLGCKPKISSIECIIDPREDLSGGPEPLSRDEVYIVKPYLIECAGRLLMVRRWIHPLHRDPCLNCDRTCAFEVFEANLSTKPCRWRRINDLGGHALFVSSSCSKSFPAEKCGVQENCIYFMNEGVKLVAYPLRDSSVYNMRNGVIIPFLSETAAVPRNLVGQCQPAWFFPTQAM